MSATVETALSTPSIYHGFLVRMLARRLDDEKIYSMVEIWQLLDAEAALFWAEDDARGATEQVQHAATRLNELVKEAGEEVTHG